jgi:hypothetical protein
METKTPQMPYVINTGSSSAAKPIVIGVLAIAGVYFGSKAYKAYLERKGEGNLDTPEGMIAGQLKALFDQTIVSDEDFRKIYLQVNSSNKDEVYKIYRQIAHRNLSDDMVRIGQGTLIKTAKTEVINSKANGVIKIDANEDIKFLVAKGSKVFFTNPKMAVWLYASPNSIIWNLTAVQFQPKVSPYDKIKISVINRKDVLIVDQVKILPYEGAKLAEGWTKYFKPIVRTRQVFAIVRIGIKDNKGVIKYLWCDARDLSTATTLKGIDAPKCIGQLIS